MLKFMSIKNRCLPSFFHMLKEQVIWLLFSLNPKLANSRWFEHIHSVFWYRNSTVSEKASHVFSTTPFFSSEFAWEIRHSWGTPGIRIGYHPLDFRFHFLRRLCREMPKEQAIWWVLMGSQHLKKGLRRLHLKDPSIQHTTLRINRFIRPRNSCFFWGGKLLLSSWIRDCQDFRILVTCDDRILWTFTNGGMKQPSSTIRKEFSKLLDPSFFHPLWATPTPGAQLELPAELELEPKKRKNCGSSWEARCVCSTIGLCCGHCGHVIENEHAHLVHVSWH